MSWFNTVANTIPGISTAGNAMKIFLLLSVFISGMLSATFVHAETETGAGLQHSETREWKLAEEQWDLVKHGEQLLKMPMMHEVVEAWSRQQGQVIELRYPGGEEGELWVEGLMDWLISLGIASQYLLAVPGSGEADVIMIKILKTGDI